MLSTRVGVSHRDNKGPPEYPRCQNANSGIILPELAAVIYETGRRQATLVPTVTVQLAPISLSSLYAPMVQTSTHIFPPTLPKREQVKMIASLP